MPFVKGISGNPRGRPEDAFGKIVRAKKGLPEKLFATALELLKSEDEDIKLKALVFLKESGWGKAVQMVDTPPDGELARMVLIRQTDEKQ